MSYRFIILFLAAAFIQIACPSGESRENSESFPNETPADTIVVDPSLNLEFITGRFEPASHDRFVEIPEKYADRQGMYMQKEAFESFLRMWEAARKDRVHLVIRSAARNFDYQKGIWERKWTGATNLSDGTRASDIKDPRERALKILEYSAMPGTSRHHWGTDIDFNNFNNRWFEAGEGLRLFEWLDRHAGDYGFCRPYTARDSIRPEGYNEEKWHWSYMPLASKYQAFAANNLDDGDIKGFKGSETAAALSVVRNYVLGINPVCK